MTVSTCVAFSLLVATASAGVSVNKCCASDQQLNRWLTDCEVSDVNHTAGDAWWLDASVRDALGAAGAAAWVGAEAEATARAGLRPCSFENSLVLSARSAASAQRFRLLPDGGLLLLNVWRAAGAPGRRTPANVTLSAGEWCGERAAGGSVMLLACPCARVTCVNRCCSSKSAFRAEHGRGDISARCEPAPPAPPPEPLFHDGRRPAAAPDLLYVELALHQPGCDPARYAKYLLNSNPEAVQRLRRDGGDAGDLSAPLRWWLQPNGSALLEHYGHGSAFPRAHFCLTDVLYDDGARRHDVFFCAPRHADISPGADNIYYSVVFLCGSAFLVLTLLVHALVPDLRRSAHAKALMCHCAALTVASVTLTVNHLRRRLPQPYCTASALVVQYFFLATFFWLNVMCLDVAMAFSAMAWRPGAGARGRGGPGRGRRRFVLYSLYAWGCPALLSALTAFLQFYPSLPHRTLVLPNIGARRCWFDTRTGELLFYYLPALLLLAVDSALFAFTVRRIRSEHRQTAHTLQSIAGATAPRDKPSAPDQAQAQAQAQTSALNTKQRQLLRVLTRLFVVMGVTWLLEVAAWLLHLEAVPFWYVTDPLNFLRGLLIFVLFCCKRPVLVSLSARLGAMAPLCCGQQRPATSQGDTSSRTVRATSI